MSATPSASYKPAALSWLALITTDTDKQPGNTTVHISVSEKSAIKKTSVHR